MQYTCGGADLLHSYLCEPILHRGDQACLHHIPQRHQILNARETIQCELRLEKRYTMMLQRACKSGTIMQRLCNDYATMSETNRHTGCFSQIFCLKIWLRARHCSTGMIVTAPVSGLQSLRSCSIASASTNRLCQSSRPEVCNDTSAGNRKRFGSSAQRTATTIMRPQHRIGKSLPW